MATFLQMMAKQPEVVKTAQSEIDKITKQERLPTMDDRKGAPIIDCIMKEVFRYVCRLVPRFNASLKLIFPSFRINPPVPMCRRLTPVKTSAPKTRYSISPC